MPCRVIRARCCGAESGRVLRWHRAYAEKGFVLVTKSELLQEVLE